jgi:hypothetical protein
MVDPGGSTMMSNQQDKRREERVSAVLPVSLGNAEGTTCDVSASGMYFETSATFSMGDEIDFSVEFDAPDGKRILKCRGNIVRTVVHGNRLGVAVKILDSRMETSETSSPEARIAAR